MPLISIIVPVYNSETRIRKCIDSILDQSFTDFELILVDDGSEDLSGKICEEYVLKDNRVKVIHQVNGGVSAARNIGLDHSRGEYIGFVDSDDYIEKKMYETLYNLMIKNDADIVVCGVKEVHSNKYVLPKNNDKLVILDKLEAMRYLFIGKNLTMYAVNKLYKKKLFDEIRYPVGKIYEDTAITPKAFSFADKIIYTPENLYTYVKCPDSITTSKYSEKDLDIIYAGESILKLAEKRFSSLIVAAEYRSIWSYMYVLDRMILGKISNQNNNYKKVVKFLKENKIKIFKNPYFSLKRKLGVLFLVISEKLYRNLILRSFK